MLADRKLQMVALIIVCSLGWLGYSAKNIIEREKARFADDPVAVPQAPEADSGTNPDGPDGSRVPTDRPPERSLNPNQNNNQQNNRQPNAPNSRQHQAHPFEDVELRIAGSVNRLYLFHGHDTQGEFALTQRDLAGFGYKVLYIRTCHGQLWWEGEPVQDLYCQRIRSEQPDPRPTFEPTVFSPLITKAENPAAAER